MLGPEEWCPNGRSFWKIDIRGGGDADWLGLACSWHLSSQLFSRIIYNKHTHTTSVFSCIRLHKKVVTIKNIMALIVKQFKFFGCCISFIRLFFFQQDVWTIQFQDDSVSISTFINSRILYSFTCASKIGLDKMKTSTAVDWYQFSTGTLLQVSVSVCLVLTVVGTLTLTLWLNMTPTDIMVFRKYNLKRKLSFGHSYACTIVGSVLAVCRRKLSILEVTV